MAGDDLFSGAAEERLAARAPWPPASGPAPSTTSSASVTSSAPVPRCGRSSKPTA